MQSQIKIAQIYATLACAQICEKEASRADVLREYKCTLVSDGRKDAAGRPLINFVEASLLGEWFIGVDDMSGVEKNAENPADGLAKRLDADPDRFGLLLTD